MKDFNLFESLDEGLDEAIAHAEGKKIARTKRIKFKVLPHYSAEEIKSMRRKLQLSQSSMGNALGVSKKTVEAWEAGTNKPNGSAERLLQIIEADPETFMEEITEAEENLVNH